MMRRQMIMAIILIPTTGCILIFMIARLQMDCSAEVLHFRVEALELCWLQKHQ